MAQRLTFRRISDASRASEVHACGHACFQIEQIKSRYCIKKKHAHA